MKKIYVKKKQAKQKKTSMTNSPLKQPQQKKPPRTQMQCIQAMQALEEFCNLWGNLEKVQEKINELI